MQEFAEKVKGNRGLVVCFFMLPTCPACRQAKAVIKGIYEENPDVTFYEFNIEHCRDIFDAMNVKQCPCFTFLKGRTSDDKPKEIGRQLGWNTQDMKMKISQFI